MRNAHPMSATRRPVPTLLGGLGVVAALAVAALAAACGPYWGSYEEPDPEPDERSVVVEVRNNLEKPADLWVTAFGVGRQGVVLGQVRWGEARSFSVDTRLSPHNWRLGAGLQAFSRLHFSPPIRAVSHSTVRWNLAANLITVERQAGPTAARQ